MFVTVRLTTDSLFSLALLIYVFNENNKRQLDKVNNFYYYLVKLINFTRTIMTTISAQVSDELYKSLNDIAKQLHRSSSYIIREAITSYIEEIKEDIEDTNDAIKILAMNNPSRSLEEVIKDLGLENELDD
jgi:predicted DNA-binding protein